MKVGLQTLSFS